MKAILALLVVVLSVEAMRFDRIARQAAIRHERAKQRQESFLQTVAQTGHRVGFSTAEHYAASTQTLLRYPEFWADRISDTEFKEANTEGRDRVLGTTWQDAVWEEVVKAYQKTKPKEEPKPTKFSIWDKIRRGTNQHHHLITGDDEPVDDEEARQKEEEAFLASPQVKHYEAVVSHFRFPTIVAAFGDYWGILKEAARVVDYKTEEDNNNLAPRWVASTESFNQPPLNSQGEKSRMEAAINMLIDGKTLLHGLGGVAEKIHTHLEELKKASKEDKDFFGSEFFRTLSNPVWKFVGNKASSWVSRMSKLSAHELDTMALPWNDDHFAYGARYSYLAGHDIARDRALAAGQALAQFTAQPSVKGKFGEDTIPVATQKKIIRMMDSAYIAEASAAHFLTDLFAAGHMRSPRYEMRAFCSAPNAGMTTNVAHDEDNFNGLLVANKKGFKWWAFGDMVYFDARNAQNRWMEAKTLQVSVDEVYAAFIAGLKGQSYPKAAEAFDYLPSTIAGLSDLERQENTCPYLKMSNKVWYIRADRGPQLIPRSKFAQDMSLPVSRKLHWAPNPFVNVEVTATTTQAIEKAIVDMSKKQTAVDLLKKKDDNTKFGCRYVPMNGKKCCSAVGGRAKPQHDLENTYINMCAISQGNGANQDNDNEKDAVWFAV